MASVWGRAPNHLNRQAKHLNRQAHGSPATNPSRGIPSMYLHYTTIEHCRATRDSSLQCNIKTRHSSNIRKMSIEYLPNIDYRRLQWGADLARVSRFVSARLTGRRARAGDRQLHLFHLRRGSSITRLTSVGALCSAQGDRVRSGPLPPGPRPPATRQRPRTGRHHPLSPDARHGVIGASLSRIEPELHARLRIRRELPRAIPHLKKAHGLRHSSAHFHSPRTGSN